jgi:hypothetical protein
VRCQCNLMLGLFECTGADADSGWMRVGASIRMAQILRLGYEDDVEDGTRRLDPTRSSFHTLLFNSICSADMYNIFNSLRNTAKNVLVLLSTGSTRYRWTRSTRLASSSSLQLHKITGQ